MNKGKTKTGALFGKKPYQGKRTGPKAVIPNKATAGPATPPGMPAGPGAGAPPGKAAMLAKMLAGGMPDSDSDMM